MILSHQPVSEARSHPEEVLSGVGPLHRPLQSEEGVVLYGTLPQMLGGLLALETEHERVFLLLSMVVILDNHQLQLLTVEVQLCHLRPVKYKEYNTSTCVFTLANFVFIYTLNGYRSSGT